MRACENANLVCLVAVLGARTSSTCVQSSASCHCQCIVCRRPCLYLMLALDSVVSQPGCDPGNPCVSGVFDCKPLAVMWDKYPQFYNKHNTVMFDDLRRNYVMNRQNGLVIRPFRKARFQQKFTCHLLSPSTSWQLNEVPRWGRRHCFTHVVSTNCCATGCRMHFCAAGCSKAHSIVLGVGAPDTGHRQRAFVFEDLPLEDSGAGVALRAEAQPVGELHTGGAAVAVWG